jgi:SAM-dependent methyltransferase
LTTILPDAKKRFIVEIGCNDGSFIQSLLKHGYKTLGIDPAQNITQPLVKQGLPIINDYFSERLAKKIVKKYGHADAVYSFHTLAHIEDMNDVIRGVKTLLKRRGFLTFEVHYLGDLIRGTQYDMMYHEHQFYYSLMALKNFFAMHDMEIFDVKPVPIRGGSMMYFVQNKQFGKRKISKNIDVLLTKEKKQGLDKVKTYTAFFRYIYNTKRKLLKLLNEIKAKKQTIAGYGASGRGTTLMNYCNLTKHLIDYVIDDATAKHGAYTPGTHHEIYSSAVLNSSNRPDYVVLFAWPFIEEIKKRHVRYLEKCGKFIVPLPKVRIVS